MPDSVLNFPLHSSYQAALRVGLLIIAVALFLMIVVRITMSVASIARVKARKEWMIEPPIGKGQSLLSRLLVGEADESAQEVFFSEEVQQMLAQTSARKKHTRVASRSH